MVIACSWIASTSSPLRRSYGLRRFFHMLATIVQRGRLRPLLTIPPSEGSGVDPPNSAKARWKSRWRRSYASFTTTRSEAIRSPMPEMAFPGSSAITTVRQRRRLRRSTSSPASSWAAFPVSSACAGSSRSVVTRSSSRRTRKVRTPSSSASFRTRRLSSPRPFWPAYLTANRIARASNLKLAITAGIGSDHVDLQAAIDRNITVAEVTYSNSISVSEHVVMMILSLVRNYIPSHQWVLKGGWNIADCVSRSYDLEGMQVGTVAAGRIGSAVLRRLKPFEVGLHYTDRHRLPENVERELNVTYHSDVESLVSVCDVVTINAPLHPETEHLFNDALIAKMKRGAYIVNTARSKICDRDAIVRALESGQLAGYAGDVWFPQPAPKDHPWRTMPHHGMTPHISGTSLSAQARYAAGTGEILECWFEKRPIRDEYLIVDGGKLAGTGAHSYSAGNATGGSEEAAKFKSAS